MALFRASDTPMAKSRTAPASPADQHNIIGASTTVEGTLRSSGNVNISGTVNGSVEVDGRTMVMAGGTVDGELTSTSAEIAGTVKGQVTIAERLVLKASAVVEGDIRTGKLVVEDGARFDGQCVMGGTPGRGSADRPARSGGASVVGSVPEAA